MISRKWLGWLIACVLATGTVQAQQIIENPEKPLSKNAGRVLPLQEIWRITDQGGEFFFQSPSDLQVADDGTVFLADIGQLLKFSSEGKFLKSLYRKGAGPGEIHDFFYYRLHGTSFFIWSPSNRRFWRAHQDGVFREDLPLPNQDYSAFLGILPGGFLFQRSFWPPLKQRTGKLMDVLETLVLIGKNGKEQEEIYSFRHRQFLGNQAVGLWDLSFAVLSPDAKRVFGYHGRDYLVEVLDLDKKTIVKRFRRPYPKVPHVESRMEVKFQKRHGPPRIKFESDITNLYAAGANLCVETSIANKDQGTLFDVFAPDGRWLDSFFLGAGRKLMKALEDFVFILEKNADETFRLVKYRIKN